MWSLPRYSDFITEREENTHMIQSEGVAVTVLNKSQNEPARRKQTVVATAVKGILLLTWLPVTTRSEGELS